MAITNATSLRKNLFNYLDAAAMNDEKIYVTTKKGTAVIVSEEYLRDLEETCYLYSLPGMRKKIIEGANTPLSECEEINWEKELE